MRILVMGSGGREHAIVWKLSQSSRVHTIFCAPGNAGMEQIATCVPIPITEIEELVTFVKEQEIDLTIVGPELPLVNGIVDIFNQHGLAIFGPSKDASLLEGSKRFAKAFMLRHHIPTAAYQTFTSSHSAKEYVKGKKFPLVIKADGLAQGKGVIVSKTEEEAIAAIVNMVDHHIFKDAGKEILIEEYLTGEEVSLMAFVSGDCVVPMPLVKDFKRAFDYDQGLNTGGLGAYSPVLGVTEETIQSLTKEILLPTVQGLKAEGITYNGVLYAGLMLTEDGPKVIEFNVRFGDPETQVILPRLETDLVEIILSVNKKKLGDVDVRFKNESALCVVMASEGYPGSFKSGRKISGIPKNQDTFVFHAGTKKIDNDFYTNGGRVLAVTTLGKNLADARENTYNGLNGISFKGAHFRKDIGLEKRSLIGG